MPPKRSASAKRAKVEEEAEASNAHPAVAKIEGHKRAEVQVMADFVQSKTKYHPKIAIICGSGLGGLADIIEDSEVVDFHDIPGFPVSTVAGHKGRLVFGNLSGKEVVCMQGRTHFYEGYSIHTTTLPVRVLRLLGADFFIVTNAAGGINPEFKVGDVMIMRDHINFAGMAGVTALLGSNDDSFGPRFPPMSQAYDRNLQTLALQTAHDLGFDSWIRRGVYTFLSGPSYETVAEVKMLRAIGSDAVGMSTASEVVVAVHSGFKVLGFSLITNEAIADYETEAKANHEEVMATANARAKDLQALVAAVVAKI